FFVISCYFFFFFFFSSRRRHTRSKRDWSSDVCSSDLGVHSIFRYNFLGMRGFNIGRWIPDLFSPFFSVDYSTIKPIRTLQKFSSLFNVSFFADRLADCCTSYCLFSYLFFGNNIRIKTQLLAQPLNSLNCPLSVVPKMMIVTYNKLTYTYLIIYYLSYKLLRTQKRKIPVKRNYNSLINSKLI